MLPTDMELLPNGDILVSEKGVGKENEGVSHVRLVRSGVVQPQPAAYALHACSARLRYSRRLAIDPRLRPEPPFLRLVRVPVFTHCAANVIPYYRLSRFTLDMDAGTADAAGETIVLDGVPWSSTHGGGGLAFDAQGNLFISTGDGGDRRLRPEPAHAVRARFCASGPRPAGMRFPRTTRSWA